MKKKRDKEGEESASEQKNAVCKKKDVSLGGW